MLKKLFSRKDPIEIELKPINVTPLPNIVTLFEKARAMTSMTSLKDMQSITDFRVGISARKTSFSQNQRHVAMIQPDRMIVMIPAPKPEKMNAEKTKGAASNLPPGENLQITAIAYTDPEAFQQDKYQLNTIPFFGYLMAFAYLNHRVTLFEGHKSALAAGTKNCDLVLIDSGMIPFLPENWPEIIFDSVKTGASVLIHNREKYRLDPITRKDTAPGWQSTEKDSVSSYANMLLFIIGKHKGKQAILIENEPIPILHDLAEEADQREYVKKIPFSYDKYSSSAIMKFIEDFSQIHSSTNFLDEYTWTYGAAIAKNDGTVEDVTFHFAYTQNEEDKCVLTITHP